MYEKGDIVVYSTKGPCRVDDIVYLDISGSGQERQYYVLSPLEVKASTIYSPVDNQKVVIRAVINRETAEQLLENIPEMEEIEIAYEKMREEDYKNVIRECSCEKYLRLMKTLLRRKADRINAGKKFTSVDERYLSDVSRKISLELGSVFERSAESMEKMLIEKISANM